MKLLTIKLLLLFVAFPSCFLFGQKASKASTPQKITKLPTPQGVEATKDSFTNKIGVKWQLITGYNAKEIRYIIKRTPTKDFDDIDAIFIKKQKNRKSDITFSPCYDMEVPTFRWYYYRVQAVLISNPEIKSDYSAPDYGYRHSVAAPRDTTLGKKDSIKGDTTKRD